MAEKNTDIQKLEAENELLKKQLAELSKKIDNVSVASAPTVILYCAADLQHGFTLTVRDESRNVILSFDRTFARKVMTADAFRVFASSRGGRYHLIRRNIIIGGDVPEDILLTLDSEQIQGATLDERKLSAALDMPIPDLCAMFSELCEPHKLIIARRFVDGYYAKDGRVTKEKVKALNDISKTEKGGLLRDVLKLMFSDEAKSL